jgi:ABC-type nickel/cobalt efflux system permease component RcnA
MDTAAALWGAVVASGIYHGVNPGMGWPLAVSAALMDRTHGSLYKALAALAGGHLLAMTAVLLPFSALLVLADWQREIQIAAACLVIALGIYLLINRGTRASSPACRRRGWRCGPSSSPWPMARG